MAAKVASRRESVGHRRVFEITSLVGSPELKGRVGALGSVQGAWRVLSFRGRSRADSACRTDDLGLDLLQGTQSQAVQLTAAQAPHSNGRAWSSQRRALCCSVVCSLCLVCRGSGTQVNKATANGSMDSCRGDTPGAYNPQLPSDFSPSCCGRPWDSSARCAGRVSPGAGAAPGAPLQPRVWGRRLPARRAPAVTCRTPALQERSFGKVWGLSLLVGPLPCPPPQRRIRFPSARLRFRLRGAQPETLGQVNTQVGAPGRPWKLGRWRELSGATGGSSRFSSGGVSALEGQGPADMVGVKVLFLQQHPPPCSPTLSRDAWLLPLSGERPWQGAGGRSQRGSRSQCLWFPEPPHRGLLYAVACSPEHSCWASPALTVGGNRGLFPGSK